MISGLRCAELAARTARARGGGGWGFGMGGELFGPYRLEKLLGSGGMGEVFRAYDTSKERAVALKRLLPALGGDTQFQERFRRESKLVARLNEPHIIPIYDFGEIDGQLFLTMRLVEGADGDQLVQGAMLPDRHNLSDWAPVIDHHQGVTFLDHGEVAAEAIAQLTHLDVHVRPRSRIRHTASHSSHCIGSQFGGNLRGCTRWSRAGAARSLLCVASLGCAASTSSVRLWAMRSTSSTATWMCWQTSMSPRVGCSPNTSG